MTTADPLAGAREKLAARVRCERAARTRRSFPCAALRDDPIGFSREILAFSPWDLQADWMRALVPEGSAVSVASGHKVGKSSGAGAVALWFFGTRRRARVVLMAPKVEHIEVVLWPEIRRMYLEAGRCADCRVKVASALEAGATPPRACEFCSPLGDPRWIGTDPTKGLRAPDGREIFAYTAREADAIGGISGPELLFVFDEASGIPEKVFEAMKGNEAGGARKLLLGNPLRTSGEFFDSHHKGKRFYSHVQQISSEDTPNVRAGERLVPGLATREWVEKRADEWGRASVIFGVRIVGKFPRAEEGQLVPLDVLEAAEQRWATTPDAGRLQIGVDVAFTGDDATIAARRDQKIVELVAFQGVDEETLASNVIGAARAHRRERDPFKPLVVYDANGPGARLTRALRRYADEIEIVGIMGPSRPRRPREYLQLRDEIVCYFAAWLRNGGAIPTDGKLEGEIIATKIFDAGGRKRVISNDDLRKLLKRSPDRRNACELAVWPTSAELEAKSRLARDAAGSETVAEDARRNGMDPYAGGAVDPYGGAGDPYKGVS